MSARDVRMLLTSCDNWEQRCVWIQIITRTPESSLDSLRWVIDFNTEAQGFRNVYYLALG